MVPKQAGPFDFGDEVVRSAVYVDPVTAQATVKSDPFPQQIEGIPVGYRELHVAVDRPGFTLNPTSCEQEQTRAKVTSAEGAVADLSAPFAATGCGRLGFKPKLRLKLKGGTKRGKFPALRAIFRPRPGDANGSAIVVRLPHSRLPRTGPLPHDLHQGPIQRRRRARRQLPRGRHLRPRGGQDPADRRSPGRPGHPPLLLPQAARHGPLPARPPSLPIQFEAVGRIDSVKGGIRSSFEAIPDAPISEVRLEMEGGQKGLIVNSTNLCQGKHRATVNLGAHNGRSDTLHPALQSKCKGKKHKKGGKKHRRKGSHR